MFRTNILIFLLSAALLASGCAATTSKSPLGGIEESRDVTSQYRSLTINPVYNYYYSGPEVQPDVIMGIDKNYQVVSKFWHPVDLTKEKLEHWVIWGDRESDFDGFSTRYMGRYTGAYIVDPAGKVIGDWYSKKDWGIFEFPEENVVVPHPPRNRAGFDFNDRF